MNEIRLGACRLHPRVAASLPGFCATLSARLGEPVRPVLHASYEELFAAFAAAKLELAWMPPMLLKRALVAGGTLLALPARAGSMGYRSAILVREKSELRDLASLRGLRAAWVDRSSASGYVSPRFEVLKDPSFDPEHPFSAETFHGATVRAAAAVAAGEADFCACFVTEKAADDSALAKIDLQRALGPLVDRLRVLHIGASISSDGLIAPAHLPASDRERLSSALLSLHQSQGGPQAIEALLQAGELRAASSSVVDTLTAAS